MMRILGESHGEQFQGEKEYMREAKWCTATAEGRLLIAERGCQAGLGFFSALEISREFSEKWNLDVGLRKPEGAALATV